MKKFCMLISLLLVLGLCTACGGRERIETGEMKLFLERPAQHSLEEMIDNAPYIVRGVWKEQLENTQDQYGDTYSHFTFEMTERYKPTADLPENSIITVTRRKAFGYEKKYARDPQGLLQLEVPDPYFTEPEPGSEAVLLLSYVPGEDAWIPAGFPWLLEVEGDELTANTHYLEKASVETESGDDLLYVTEIDYGDLTFDSTFLDGLTVAAFFQSAE